MKFITFKTRAEWLEWRMSGIGSSDSMAVMGASPWLTRDQLWAQKTERMLPQKSMPWMKRGQDLEPLARKKYETMVGRPMNPANVAHEKHSFLIASLDGISAKGNHLVEIKCPGTQDHAVALKGKVPDKYVWQLTHQLLVTGLKEMDYFSFDGEKGVIVRFVRNVQFEKALLAAETSFWESVIKDIEPGKPAPELNFQEKIAKVISLKGVKK